MLLNIILFSCNICYNTVTMIKIVNDTPRYILKVYESSVWLIVYLHHTGMRESCGCYWQVTNPLLSHLTVTYRKAVKGEGQKTPSDIEYIPVPFNFRCPMWLILFFVMLSYLQSNMHLVPHIVNGMRSTLFVLHGIRPDQDHLPAILTDPFGR